MKRINEDKKLILLNGDFRTQDSIRPRAEAVAIEGSRIRAVGTDDEIEPMVDSRATVVDLGGRLALPGFADSHIHLYDWALGKKQLNLAGIGSYEKLLRAVAEKAGETKKGEWIIGGGWNENDWPEKRIPGREDLDRAAKDHPVALWRCDLHVVSVNSLALERCGIGADTPNPKDGVIVRDESGQATGVLRERANEIVKNAIPEPDENEVLDAVLECISDLHALGITGVSDIRLLGGTDGSRMMRIWQYLYETGLLNLRCRLSLPGERLDEAIALGMRSGFGNERLRIGHVKMFADGAMGSRTAWLIDPYLDAEYGMPLLSSEELEYRIHQADSAGLAVMVHAIGDRTNREVISVFENIRRKKSRNQGVKSITPAISHRIDHVQMIRPEDVARLARIGVYACVQPHNMVLDIDMINDSVGPNGKWAYAYKDLLKAGIPTIFSSDAPVCSANPLDGIHAAVTRRKEDGSPKGGWYPEQRISVEEAVRGYTITPAISYRQGNDLGGITIGKLADIVILEDNIYQIDPMEICNTNVEMTIFDGEIVYRREE